VTPRFAPFIGGVETHTEEVARRLAERGHQVTIATTDPDGGLPPTETRDGVVIRRVNAWPRHRDWHFAPGLLPIIRGGDWDIVHLQGVHTLVPPLGAVGAALARRPFVLTFHSGGHSSRLRTAARGVQWRLLAPLLRRAAALVGVSRFEVERFSRELALPRDRFTLIRNGAAAGATSTETAAPAVGGQRADTAGGPLILSLGRLERYKGHHRIIGAMPAILSAIPTARLHVAGSGPYEGDLRRLVSQLGVEDAVTIGAIPRGDVSTVICDAALVVLLSEYEAHPVAVMEAVAARRRVLVADTTGFRELAEDGLVRAIPIDVPPEAVAAAVVEEIGKPALEAAPTLATWDDTTDELERLYRRVAAAN
jgi:glycosyltransferase involved in cell wall biosynthesis